MMSQSDSSISISFCFNQSIWSSESLKISSLLI